MKIRKKPNQTKSKQCKINKQKEKKPKFDLPLARLVETERNRGWERKHKFSISSMKEGTSLQIISPLMVNR